MQGMQAAALQGSMMKAKLDEIEREKKRREMTQAAMGKLLGSEGNAPSDGMGPVLPGSGLLGNPETAGRGGLLSAMPEDVQGQFLGNYLLQQTAPKELPNDVQELLYYQTHPETFQMAQDLKRAGAATTPIKIDLKMGESIAQQVGPLVKGTYESAVAGSKLVDSSQRIMQAVEKGNAIVGPTANLRLKGAQIAEVLGVGGKDNAEKLANTRQIIRATAEQAVAARSMLGGQAQISNAEQELITKATAGDIADLTMGELGQIAQISERLGRQMYQIHQDKLKVMQGDPATSGMAPYYQPPEILPPYQGGGASSGWGIQRVK
jgi:hypothetical protein